MFTPRDADRQAPIDVMLPEVRRLPLHQLINDPFRALQEGGRVKLEATMADLLRVEVAAA